MFRSSPREQRGRKGGRSSQKREGTICVKGQRHERPGSILGIARTSLWWECEYEGVVARERVRQESRGQILKGWLGHGEECRFYLKTVE